MLPLRVSVPPAAFTDMPPAPVMRPVNVGAMAFSVSVSLPAVVKVCRV